MAAPLTNNQIETIMQGLTIQMLPLPAGVSGPSFVRIGWQTDGQPVAKGPDVDVVTIRVVEEDDEYNRIRDRIIISTNQSSEQYTRVWRVFWVLYGPNALENARKIRSGLLADATHDTLTGSSLFLLTDMRAPVRLPEVFQGQWYNRVDFEALFNENVIETTPVGTVRSSEIIIETPAGQAADITVTGD